LKNHPRNDADIAPTGSLPPEHGPASGAPLDTALIFFRRCARRFILVNASEYE